MGLFKQAHVRGINHELIAKGVLTYPSAKIAEDAADAVAENLPEEEIPEVTGEDGLSAEQAAEVIEQLAAVADAIAEQAGGAQDLDVNKVASEVNLQEIAWAHAQFLVKQAMEEGTTNPGQGGAEPELTGAEAQVDAMNTPSSALVVAQGATSVDTSPGEVGAEKTTENQPGTLGTPASASDAEVKAASELIRVLRKLSADGTLPTEGGRQDLNTNSAISTPVVTQGTTNATKPTEANPQKDNPATVAAGLKTTGSAPADVGKLAAFLNHPEVAAAFRQFNA